MYLDRLELVRNDLGITVVKITVKCKKCGCIKSQMIAMKSEHHTQKMYCDHCDNWATIEIFDYDGSGVVDARIIERKEESEMDKNEENTYEVKCENEESESQFDTVNNPAHYASTSVECIDIMIETQGMEAVRDFCLCNAFKYLWRHNIKNGNEDVKKAAWYLNKYLELTE